MREQREQGRRVPRRVYVLIVGLVLSVGLGVGPPRPAKVTAAVWSATAAGPADLLVALSEQANLAPAARLPTKEVKGRFVYRELTQTAQRGQASLRHWLEQHGISYEPFFLVNALRISADRQVVMALAARSDVARIEANPWVLGIAPQIEPAVGALAATGVEWNVSLIGADAVWTTYGVRGEGIVVAGNDTGIEWDHPALKSHYHGWNGSTADHNRHWLDAIDNSPVPLDDHDHGTHTLGTMVGDDGGGNQIGVAPGARWIGCRNMDHGVGSPTTYMTCFQFFLAPYPLGGDPFTDGDPTLAPHVINNSWLCPPAEGCSQDTLRASVEALRAAGIVVAVAAGNSGPACSTIGEPAAIYESALTVGASDAYDHIASFSNRGPVVVDGSGRRKPDLAAPGVNVRSSVRGGGYASGWNGTSMATPHVAGTVALLWSAAPSLIGKVDLTERILRLSAHPHASSQGCGGDGPTAVPNNVWGWGRLDALAAVEIGLTCPAVGDFDGDSQVTVVDIMQVAAHWGLHQGDAGYLPAYDLDGDGTITVADIMAVAGHWQEACREP